MALFLFNSDLHGGFMEKLFYKDTNITDFDAVVTDCFLDEKSGLYRIILDRTAFFPEEGGQTADKGTLNGAEVLDVRIRDDVIYHIMEKPINVNETVSGHVDRAQRFDFMQQHSGEHIISGLVHKYYNLDNVGFHLSVNEVTLDFNGELSLSQLRAIEAEANAAVWKGIPVKVSFPSKDELRALNYRSKKELSGEVRIVEIPGIDICACCAPHVDNTARIGLIKITGVQNHRGGVRVNICCGGRAVSDYTEKQDSVSDISVQLSARQSEIADAVRKLRSDMQKQKERINDLQAKLLKLQMAQLPSPSDTENAILFVEALDNIAMRNAVNSLTGKYTGCCGVFAGNDSDGYHYIIGSSSKDCRESAAAMREKFGAKGGGNERMIQGSVIATQEAILSLLS